MAPFICSDMALVHWSLGGTLQFNRGPPFEMDPQPSQRVLSCVHDHWSQLQPSTLVQSYFFLLKFYQTAMYSVHFILCDNHRLNVHFWLIRRSHFDVTLKGHTPSQGRVFAQSLYRRDKSRNINFGKITSFKCMVQCPISFFVTHEITFFQHLFELMENAAGHTSIPTSRLM